MDFLKNQIQRIQQQLSGLTASQRMLTAALVAIMVMTLVYWGRYAGTAEMEPLLDQDFQQNDVAAITGKLQGKGIPYDVQGNRILVSSERRWEALADIAYAKLLPRNSVAGFDEMVDKLKPWASPSERDAMYNHAREGMCTQIIQRWPGVEHAAVMVTADTRRAIGQKVEPTATVDITMANGEEPDKRLIEAAAATVAGSTPGMKPKNVMVVVNGVHRPTGPADITAGVGAGGGATQLELIQQYEQHRAGGIREILRDIPGVFVGVVVEVDANLVEKQQQTYDKDNTLSLPTRTKQTDITSGGEGAAAPPDPGAVANTQLQIDPVAGGNDTPGTSESVTEEDLENLASVTKTMTKSFGGSAKIMSASVRVPRSYFWRVIKGRTPEGQTPDEAAVDKYVTEQLPRIKASVLGTLGNLNPDALTVESYSDALPTQLAVAGAAPATATASITTSIGRFGKEIALGGLALVSLFMVSMMVRKSAPAPVIPAAAAAPPGPPPMLMAGEAVAGEAGDSNTMLAGMELDEDAMVTQQMLDQVSTMVKDNPDAAASLVKRWLNRA